MSQSDSKFYAISWFVAGLVATLVALVAVYVLAVVVASAAAGEECLWVVGWYGGIAVLVIGPVLLIGGGFLGVRLGPRVVAHSRKPPRASYY